MDNMSLSEFQFLIGNVLARKQNVLNLRLGYVSIPYRQCLSYMDCCYCGVPVQLVSIPYRQCLS